MRVVIKEMVTMTFEVDYQDGRGFQPTPEARAIGVLAHTYKDLETLIEIMKKGQEAETCAGTIYRLCLKEG